MNKLGRYCGTWGKNDENLVLTLKDRIEHHYTTGISTVKWLQKIEFNSIRIIKPFLVIKI